MRTTGLFHFTSISCKVQEHVIYSSNMDHHTKKEKSLMLSMEFGKRRSCELQLKLAIQDLAKVIEEKKT